MDCDGAVAQVRMVQLYKDNPAIQGRQLYRDTPAIQGRFSWAGPRCQGGLKRQGGPSVHIETSTSSQVDGLNFWMRGFARSLVGNREQTRKATARPELALCC
jgi:hypothetical protein